MLKDLLKIRGRVRRRLFFPAAAVAHLVIYGWIGSYMLTKRALLGLVEASSIGTLPFLWVLIGGLAVWLWLSLGVRRLHDLGASGKWLALSLIPGASIPLFLGLCVLPGEDGANRFGPDPREAGGLLTHSRDHG